ncbi:hypothetical protein, partial [Aeromonas caviae]|uniref:hypothetical protein n=1 Tax=Aeromonas caviae TaxID=648 RepID=UPI001CC4234F
FSPATVTRSARFRIACTSPRSKKLRTFAPPDTMTVGGANVRSFLERGDVQAILKRAERVTVAGENEKNPEA